MVTLRNGRSLGFYGDVSAFHGTVQRSFAVADDNLHSGTVGGQGLSLRFFGQGLASFLGEIAIGGVFLLLIGARGVLIVFLRYRVIGLFRQGRK